MANLPPPAVRQERGRLARERLVRNGFTPEFWDSLGHVHLTRQALDEVGRRYRKQRWDQRHDWLAQLRQGDEAQSVANGISLNRFAMRNGPDMAVAMEHEKVDNAVAELDPTVPALPRFPTGSSHFLQHMRENNIFPYDQAGAGGNQEPLPEDLGYINGVLAQDFNGQSENDSIFQWHEDRVRDFQVSMVTQGGDIGAGDAEHTRKFFGPIMTEFDKLNADIVQKEFLPQYRITTSVTNRTIRGPIPDLVDGSHISELHPLAEANRVLLDHICTDNSDDDDGSNLILPTFIFDEGPYNGQTAFAGAFGARAAHAMACLQSKLMNARLQGDLSLQELTRTDITQPSHRETITNSAVLWQGRLVLYAHWMQLDDGGEHQYRMTRVGNYAMRASIPEFRAGAKAFANWRRDSWQERNNLIDNLNAEYWYRGYGTAWEPNDPPIHPPPDDPPPPRPQ